MLDTTQKSVQDGERIVNEICVSICTVNGSGSATANNILYRALFRMGIPVSGKNIFPSNIKGLPTWFVIRASARGYTGRIAHDDVVVAMNAATIQEDATYLQNGGVLFYADHLEKPEIKDKDVIVYPMPIKGLMKQVDVPRNLQSFLENMLYVGIVGQVLRIPEEILKATIDHHFRGKPAIAESNFNIMKLGFQYALENIEKKDHFYLEQLPELSDYILTDGNNAGALGSLYGGLQFCAWYPITPATSLVESAIEQVGKLRKDPKTGKNTCVILQVEDELAAAGATLGAGWAGLRAMTSTSGPGISLMTENIGLAYFTETPMVIWDVQRVGPSTGLPTRTAQGDLSMLYTLGHGDTKHVILIPGTVTECFEFGWRSLDIAEKFQTPIFVLSDLDLGMNTWVTKRFEYPNQPIERGKIIWEEKLEQFKDWGRYKDLDGDGIPYRTVIGNLSEKAAYFTRGTGHDEYGNYSEDPKNWSDMLTRIGKKLKGVVKDLPGPIIHRAKAEADIGIIGMGSTHDAMIEAQDLLAEMGIQADYMRVRALPANTAVREFVASHARNYVVELNRDGQLRQILSLEISEYSEKLISISVIGGLPLTAAWTAESIYAKEKKVEKNVELNRLGLALADYKGKPSTLCPGCGHNAISNQIQAAIWELGLAPEKVMKISGIGCSSKSANYFLNRSFGFNGLHGRMPTLATGAGFGDSSIKILGISGDGDTASIGMGHFKHVIRRNVPMVYIIENNGCYGLTKGQFSATSDQGLVLKHQGVNILPPLDLCMEALISGAPFVARTFSGDVKQMKQLLKAALSQNGVAVIDVISPCVTFNNRDEALQSYSWGREHEAPIQDIAHFQSREAIELENFGEGTYREIQLQDGSYMVLKKIDKDYDPTDLHAALDLLTESYKHHYFATGLIYFSEVPPTIQEKYNLPDEPLNRLTTDRLRPGRESLEAINVSLY